MVVKRAARALIVPTHLVLSSVTSTSWLTVRYPHA